MLNKMGCREADLLFLLSGTEPDKPAVDALLALPGAIDWQSIFDAARVLQTTFLIYANLKKIGLWDAVAIRNKDSFRAAAMRAAQDAVVTLEQFKRIVRELNARDVVPMPLKGIAFSMLGVYPRMGLRVMADVDLLLDRKDMARGIDLFVKNGFEKGGDAHGRLGSDVFFSKDGMTVEVHHRLFIWICEKLWLHSGDFTGEVLARSSVAEYEGCRIRLMRTEDLVLYLCVKCAVDEYRSFRYFVDIDAIVRKYGPSMDWAAVYGGARSLRIEKKLVKIFSFLVKKMHTPIPLQGMKVAGKVFDIAYFTAKKDAWGEVLRLLLTETPGVWATFCAVAYYTAYALYFRFGWFRRAFAAPVFYDSCDGKGRN